MALVKKGSNKTSKLFYRKFPTQVDVKHISIVRRQVKATPHSCYTRYTKAEVKESQEYFN